MGWLRNLRATRAGEHAARAAEAAARAAKSSNVRNLALRTGTGAAIGAAAGYGTDAWDGDYDSPKTAFRGAVLGVVAGAGSHFGQRGLNALGGWKGIRSRIGAIGANRVENAATQAVTNTAVKSARPSTVVAANQTVGHSAPSASHAAVDQAVASLRNQERQKQAMMNMQGRMAQGARDARASLDTEINANHRRAEAIRSQNRYKAKRQRLAAEQLSFESNQRRLYPQPPTGENATGLEGLAGFEND